MRKLTLLLFILFAFTCSIKSNAQTLPPLQPEQDACNALLLCGNSFTTPYSYVGVGSVMDLTSTPCGGPPSGGEVNSLWLRLNVLTAGSIVFTITPIVATDDYDFAVLDITNTACSNIAPSNVIRCNFNNNNPGSNVNGAIGLNTTSTMPFVAGGTFGSSFLQQINANAGDSYLIMINNFGFYTGTGTPSSGFTIDFAGSTAVFADNGNPTFSSVITSCNGSQQIKLLMSENVQCGSIAANGSDFALSGGGVVSSASGDNCSGTSGYTNTLTLNFAAALPAGTYTLSAQNGTDGNTILDLCDNPVPVGHAIQFTIPPYVAPTFVAIDTPACSEIKIKLAARVRCDSIAKNGSDFSITGPQATGIAAAYGVGCDTLNFTDTVVLLLQSPLQTDGIYTITAKKGTDGNTIMDSCGLYQPVGDAITLNINSYDGLLVSSSDSILCSAQYIQLQAANASVPPLSIPGCDTSITSCNGNFTAAFVGTKDSSSAANTPFSGAFQDSKAQFLFRAEELRNMGLKAGSIRALEFKVTQKLSTAPFNNLTIKIGCTSLPDITSNYINVSNIAYTTSSYTTTPGWNRFDLTTPYNWDGTSNLVVEVCYDNSGGASANDWVAHSPTGFSSVYRRYGNSLPGCAITTEGTLSSVTTLRPRIRFYVCEPPVGQPVYAWTPGNVLSDSTSQNPLAYIFDNVNYHVTTIDRYGCAHRDSSSFTLSQRTVFLEPADTAICFGEKAKIEAGGGLNYSWLAADPSTLSCLNCPDPVAQPSVTSLYQVVISDQYDCHDTLASQVIIKPLPPVNIQPHDTVVKYGTTIRLIGSGAYLYSWYPPNVITSYNDPAPLAEITGPVTLYLTGISENGCRNMDSVRIGVDYRDAVVLPSAFTPNGDGLNDIFHIGSISFQRLQEFRIFNRWGQEIFSTTDPKMGWDGSFNGKPQEAGVYQFIIRLAYPDGKVDVYKGDVTLVR